MRNAVAFWRNELTERPISLDIFFTRALSFEYRLSSATSVLVQGFGRRRLVFLAIRRSNHLKRSRAFSHAFGTSMLHHCGFNGLYRPSPDDLPCRLCLKDHWLLCARIDATSFLCCRLLDNNKFGKSGQHKSSRSIEFLVA